MPSSDSLTTLGRSRQLNLAHDALMVQDAQALLSADRQATAGHRQKMNGTKTAPGGDDMIVAGDYTDNRKTSSLGTIALAAALAATGVGLPIAAGIIGNAMFSKPAAVAPVPPTPVFNDSKFDLDLVNPDQ